MFPESERVFNIAVELVIEKRPSNECSTKECRYVVSQHLTSLLQGHSIYMSKCYTLAKIESPVNISFEYTNHLVNF